MSTVMPLAHCIHVQGGKIPLGPNQSGEVYAFRDLSLRCAA